MTASHHPGLNSNLSNYSPKERDALDNTLRRFMDARENPELVTSTFPRFVRFQDVTRFLVMYELFGKVLNLHGNIVEVGVLNGFNIFALAHFSEIFEPRHYTRKIYGFDTFAGYSSITSEKDGALAEAGVLDRFVTLDIDQLLEAVEAYNAGIQFSQFKKIELVKGNAVETIPKFVAEHPESIVSMLVCYTDTYAPTKAALEHFWPRMPIGGIVVFCSANYEEYPGETQALNDVLGISNHRLRRFEFATKFSYIVKE